MNSIKENKLGFLDQLVRLKECIDLILTDESVLKNYPLVKDAILDCLQKGGKIFLVGNGGSAAECQHIAAEFVGRFSVDRIALPAIALTADTSILTAVSNDYGYEALFERQIRALGGKHDILIALSTSGNSENIIRACKSAKSQNMTAIGFTGQNPGKMAQLCSLYIAVPSTVTALIQELHLSLLHCLCREVDEAYVSS